MNVYKITLTCTEKGFIFDKTRTFSGYEESKLSLKDVCLKFQSDFAKEFPNLIVNQLDIQKVG